MIAPASPDPLRPTPAGIAKYPPEGFYEGDPCVCEGNCPDKCRGECGCEACRCAALDGSGG